MSSRIVVSFDVEFARSKIRSDIDSKLVKEYICDEFKVEHAKEVIKEAYIAEEKKKYLLICAKGYRIEAQNALLKLLEEPPRNIEFILIASSKSTLLPTIRSRLSIEMIESKKLELDLNLDLAKMDLKEIFDFLKEHRHIKKLELKAIIEELFVLSVNRAKIRFNEKELEIFQKAQHLSELNARPISILSQLLLTIYQARGRK